MGDLSPHFSKWEFRDRRTGEVKVDPRLVAHLEVLRCWAGSKPLRIVSGYRSPATNAAVGGAKNSEHLYGRAVDIPRGYATVQQARDAGFTGIGRVGTWATHVDVRPGPRREWAY